MTFFQIENIIKDRLAQKFNLEKDIIEVLDPQGDGRHLGLRIISSLFSDLNRVERSQFVYGLLDDLIKEDHIHALNLQLKTPEEYNA